MKPTSQLLQASNGCHCARRGMSMMEVVIAVALSTMIAAGLQGAIGVSLRGLPDSQGVLQSSIRSSMIIDRLAAELETAIYITEHTATAIGFTLPDRNADGNPERVRYSWTGTPGGPLTRQYNGGTAETVVGSCSVFGATPSVKIATDSYPSLCVEDAAESLLIDYSSQGPTNDYDIKALNWTGQYLTMTTPANAYTWRPTRIQFLAKIKDSPGTTLVQMRPATIGLAPAASVLEQYSLSDSALATAYAYQSFSFTQLDPITSGGAICLVLQNQTGQTSATVRGSAAAAGLTTTTTGGVSWTYTPNRALCCQMFGKLGRSSGSQYVSRKYVTSIALSLQVAPTAPAVQRTVPLLNHPELLAGLWELDFTKNPTTCDVNGDGLSDWVTHDGQAFSMASVSGGTWSTTSTQLDTSPGNDFGTTSVIDLRFQNTTVGGSGAVFSINALRSGATCAPIKATLQLQTDGTQTLAISSKSSDAVITKLLAVAGLPGQLIDLRLIIDPATTAVSIRVNGVDKGTFPLTRFSSSDASRVASISGSGSNAAFTYARVRVLEQ